MPIVLSPTNPAREAWIADRVKEFRREHERAKAHRRAIYGAIDSSDEEADDAEFEQGLAEWVSDRRAGIPQD